MRIWVTPMRCRAALSWRLPERVMRIGRRCCLTRPGWAPRGIAGEGGLAFEPRNPGCLAHELGRGQLPTARQSQQRRSDGTDPLTNAVTQLLDGGHEPDYVGQLLVGRLGDWAGLDGQPVREGALMFARVQRAGPRNMSGIKLVHPPQQPVDRRSALADKDFAAIHQHLQLPQHLVV